MGNPNKKFSKHKGKNKNRAFCIPPNVLNMNIQKSKEVSFPCSLLRDLYDGNVSTISYHKYKKECNKCSWQYICPIKGIANDPNFGQSPHASMPSIISIELINDKSKLIRHKCLNTKYLSQIKVDLKHVTELSRDNELFRLNKLERNSAKTIGKGAKSNGFNPEVGGRR